MWKLLQIRWNSYQFDTFKRKQNFTAKMLVFRVEIFESDHCKWEPFYRICVWTKKFSSRHDHTKVHKIDPPSQLPELVPD